MVGRETVAIVVNWNGAAGLADCLDALVTQDEPLAEIVVVDNASSDGSRRIAEDLEAAHPSVRVLRNPVNRGFAGGVNDGLAVTDSPYVLVCNHDVRPRPDYVRRAAAVLRAEPRVSAVQGKLLRQGRRDQDGAPIIDTTGHVAHRPRVIYNRGEGEADRGQWEAPGEVFGVSGALALYRREALEDLALDGFGRHGREVFDEDLFAFFEDVDLDWRAQLRGWQARYEPTAVAEHERGGAGPRRTVEVERLNFANRLLVVYKCDDRGRLARALPGFVVTTILKAAWLLLTSPRALLRAVGTVLRLLPTMRAKRRAVLARATVPPPAVVDTWFRPFDYRGWVTTWWRRRRTYPSPSPSSPSSG